MYGVQERQECWLGPDYHLLSNRLNKRCIADELERISQAMITAHQNSLARKWCAIPDVLQMTRPVPARHTSSGTQYRIADRPCSFSRYRA